MSSPVRPCPPPPNTPFEPDETLKRTFEERFEKIKQFFQELKQQREKDYVCSITGWNITAPQG